MDEKEAREALASADAAASRLRRGGRWHVGLVCLLGLAAMALTAGYGLLLEPSSVRYVTPAVLLFPLFGLVVYTATRPVVARRRRTLYPVLTSAGSVVYTLVVLVGTVRFSGEPLWWVPGSVLCAVPFFVVAAADRKTGRTARDVP